MWKLIDLKEFLKSKEKEIKLNLITIIFSEFINGRIFELYFTKRFFQKTSRANIWLSKEFLTTLKNYKYGFDDKQQRSISGRDGIFLVDKYYKHQNIMISKIYNKYLEKEKNEVSEIAALLGVDALSFYGARIVSHHMRLLGLISKGSNRDILVLVDFDDTKEK